MAIEFLFLEIMATYNSQMLFYREQWEKKKLDYIVQQLVVIVVVIRRVVAQDQQVKVVVAVHLVQVVP